MSTAFLPSTIAQLTAAAIAQPPEMARSLSWVTRMIVTASATARSRSPGWSIPTGPIFMPAPLVALALSQARKL